MKNFRSGLFGNDVLNSLARINIARIELSNENRSDLKLYVLVILFDKKGHLCCI
jgi:hypothetical protein